ncbi:MAG: helix-turn-helix transcriptional regulator [Dehalococcoidia bacterium]
MTEQVRRASRLVEIERRLRQNPGGLTVRQLADGLGYSPRTIQRDLNVLESELGAPLVDASGRRWRILPGSTPIGAVRLSLHEARALLLAARLYLRSAGEVDADGIAALEKLADAVPRSIGQQVVAAVAEARERPADPRYVAVLRGLTQAWAASQTVTIAYHSQGSGSTKQTDLDPYLIEPARGLASSGTYVIGYSHEHAEVRTFKLDRIQKVALTERHFAPQEVPAIREQLAQGGGGVVFGEPLVEVVLEFAPEVAMRAAEVHWNDSQRVTELAGGGLRFEATLPSLLEITPWVRSWGAAVRVIAPGELRDQVAADAAKTVALYA